MKKYTQDAFKNLVSGLGTSKDRSTSGEWESYTYNGSELAAAYTSDWFVQQLVNVPSEETLRKWRKITTPSMTPEQIEQFEKAEKELRVKSRIKTCLKWALLFGGGGIYIVVDGQEPLDELVTESIQQGTGVNLISYDRNNVSAATIYQDETNPSYGTPASYTIDSSVYPIHESRFLRFDGRELPHNDWESNNYWGNSWIGPILPDIERVSVVSHALTQLVDEANVDVVSVENLFSKLANSETASAIRARFAEGEIVKSLYNVQLLDSTEEYQRHELSSSISGLTQLLQSFYEKPGAALGVPITKILGTSPGGMNATGESDLENYYDRLDTVREGIVADSLDTIDQVINQSVFGYHPDDWSYEWEPYWQMSEVEQTQVESAKIDNLVKLHSEGILSTAIVVKQVHEDGTFSAIEEDYVDDLEKLEEIDEDVTSAGQGVEGEDVSKEALNGAQIAQVTQIVTQMNAGEITRDQAFGIMRAALPGKSDNELNAMLGSESDIEQVRSTKEEKAAVMQQQMLGSEERQPEEVEEGDAEESEEA